MSRNIDLPSIRVGLLNITWNNGSREKPGNVITTEIINELYEKKGFKIDWIDENKGLIQLKGHYNYLVYREHEFFFLEKVKVVDFDKNIFVYCVERDYWMNFLAGDSTTIKGSLVKTLNEDTLWDNIQLTKSIIADPNSQEVFDVSISEGCIQCPLAQRMKITPFKREQFGEYAMICKDHLNNFFKKIKNCTTDPTIDPKAPHQILATLKALPYPKWENSIATYINDWLKDSKDLAITQETNLNTICPKLKETLTNTHHLKTNYVITKSAPTGAAMAHPTILTSAEAKNVVLKNLDFTNITKIELLDPKTLAPIRPLNRHILDLHFNRKLRGLVDDDNEPLRLMSKIYAGSGQIKDAYMDGHPISKRLFTSNYTLSSEKLQELGIRPSKDNFIYSKYGESNINVPVYYLNTWLNWKHPKLMEILKTGKNCTELGFLLYKIANFDEITDNTTINRFIYKSGPIQIVNGLKIDKELLASCADVKKLSDGSVVDLFGDKKAPFVDIYGPSSVDKSFWRTYLGGYLGWGDIEEPLKGLGEKDGKFSLTTNACWVKEDGEIYTLKDTVAEEWETDSTKLPTFKISSFTPEQANYTKARAIITQRRKATEIVETEVKGFSEGDLIWNNATVGLFRGRRNYAEEQVYYPMVALMYDCNYKNTWNKHSLKKGDFGYKIGIIQFINIPQKLSKDPANIISTDDSKQSSKQNHLPSVCRFRQLINRKQTLLQAEYDKSGGNFDNAAYLKAFSLMLDVSIRVVEAADTPYTMAFTHHGFLQAGEFTSRSLRHVLIGGVRYTKDDHPSWAQILPKDPTTGNYRRIHSCEVWGEERNPFALGFSYPFRAVAGLVSDLGKAGRGIMKIMFVGTDETLLIDLGAVVHKYNMDGFRIEVLNNLRWDKFVTKTSVTKGERACDYETSETLPEYLDLLQHPTLINAQEFKKEGGLAEYLGLKDEVNKEGVLDILLEEVANLINPELNLQNYRYFYVDDDYLKEEEIISGQSVPKLRVFKLTVEDNVSYYALFKWYKANPKPIIELILADNSSVEHESFKDITVQNKSSLISSDLAQTINQKNFLYVYGQRIPIKTKLVTRDGEVQYRFDVTRLPLADSILNRYRVYFEGEGGDVIDTKIVLPTKAVSQAYGVADSIQLERMKIEILSNQDNRIKQNIDFAEKKRLLNQSLDNRKEDVMWESQYGAKRIQNQAIGGALGAGAAFMSGNPFVAGMQVTQAYLGVSLAREQLHHSTQQGNRSVRQGTVDLANQLLIERNRLDDTHKFDEMREKNQILDMTTNIRQSMPNDADELEELNKLITKGADIAIIHQKPTDILLAYIKQFYDRYGVDIFMNDFVLSLSSIDYEKTQIWQFAHIDSIDIKDLTTYNTIKGMFLNGVRMIKHDYKVEELTAVQIKEQNDLRLRKAKLEKERIEKERLAEVERIRLLTIKADAEAKAAIGTRIGALEEAIKTQEEKIRRINLDIANKDTQIAQLNAKIEEDDLSYKQLEEFNTSLLSQEKALEKEQKRLKEELSTAEANFAQLELEKERLDGEIETCTNKLSNVPECDKSSLEEELSQLKVDLEIKETETANMERELDKLRSEVGKGDADIIQENDRLSKELARIKALPKPPAASAKTLRDLAQAKADLERLKREKLVVEGDLEFWKNLPSPSEALQAKYDKCAGDLSNSKREVEDLQRTNNTLTDSEAALKEELEASKRSPAGDPLLQEKYEKLQAVTEELLKKKTRLEKEAKAYDAAWAVFRILFRDIYINTKSKTYYKVKRRGSGVINQTPFSSSGGWSLSSAEKTHWIGNDEGANDFDLVEWKDTYQKFLDTFNGRSRVPYKLLKKYHTPSGSPFSRGITIDFPSQRMTFATIAGERDASTIIRWMKSIITASNKIRDIYKEIADYAIKNQGVIPNARALAKEWTSLDTVMVLNQ